MLLFAHSPETREICPCYGEDSYHYKVQRSQHERLDGVTVFVHAYGLRAAVTFRWSKDKQSKAQASAVIPVSVDASAVYPVGASDCRQKKQKSEQSLCRAPCALQQSVQYSLHQIASFGLAARTAV